MDKQRRYLLKLSGVSIASLTGIAGCTGTEVDAEHIAIGGGSSASGDDNGENDGESDEGEEVDGVVGDLIEGENIHLVVEDTERGADLGEFFEPDGGNEFLAIDLAMKNISDDFLSVSHLLQSRVQDDEGYSYDQTFVGDANVQFNDGQFAPGEVERGQLAYEIPEDASGLELRFDFDVSLFGDVDRAYIDLEEQDDITELEQDLQVDVHDVGQAVDFSDVEVTVDEIRFEPELGQFAEPEEGHEYAIVDIAASNETGEDQWMSSLLQMLIKDGDGRSYQEDWMATAELDRPFDEGAPIADGETRRGELVYEVPEDTSPLYWVFEFDVWVEGNKTFWEIN